VTYPVKIDWGHPVMAFPEGRIPDHPAAEEFLEDGRWKCISCGACCRNISWCLPEWQVEGGTQCIQLQPDGLCGIYATRPWICRHQTFQRAVDMSPRVFATTCAILRDLFGGVD